MIVIAIILVILVVFLCIPVGAAFRYDAGGISLSVVAGIVKIRILPKKEKRSGGKDGKKTAKKETKKKEKNSEEEASKSEERVSLGGKVAFFYELVKNVLQALSCLFHRLRMDFLYLDLCVGGNADDPAATAITYGRAWSALGILIPELEKHFDIRKREINASVSFSSEETVITAEAQITIRIFEVLMIGVYYGLKILRLFLKNRKLKNKKGGKTNGTPDEQLSD